MPTSEAIAGLLRSEGYIVQSTADAKKLKTGLAHVMQEVNLLYALLGEGKPGAPEKQDDEDTPGIEMSEKKRKVYLAIKAGNDNVQDVVDKIKLSKPTAYKYIAELISDKLVVRVGRGQFKLPGADSSSTAEFKRKQDDEDAEDSERL